MCVCVCVREGVSGDLGEVNSIPFQHRTDHYVASQECDTRDAVACTLLLLPGSSTLLAALTVSTLIVEIALPLLAPSPMYLLQAMFAHIFVARME